VVPLSSGISVLARRGKVLLLPPWQVQREDPLRTAGNVGRKASPDGNPAGCLQNCEDPLCGRHSVTAVPANNAHRF
jgi:hypothetical protein